MKIRLLQHDDLQDLLALYSHLHRTDDPLPPAPVVEAAWNDLLDPTRYAVLGGHVNGQLVSSCTLAMIPNLTRGCRPYALIENVVTHAAHRQRGHGKAMLAHALRHAWQAGCYKVMLMTGRKDDATLRFYESAGFDPNDKRAFIAKPEA